MSPKKHGRKGHSHKRKKKGHRNQTAPVARPVEDSLAVGTEKESEEVVPGVTRQTVVAKPETSSTDRQASIKADLKYIGILAVVTMTLLVVLSSILR